MRALSYRPANRHVRTAATPEYSAYRGWRIAVTTKAGTASSASGPSWSPARLPNATSSRHEAPGAHVALELAGEHDVDEPLAGSRDGRTPAVRGRARPGAAARGRAAPRRRPPCRAPRGPAVGRRSTPRSTASTNSVTAGTRRSVRPWFATEMPNSAAVPTMRRSARRARASSAGSARASRTAASQRSNPRVIATSKRDVERVDIGGHADVPGDRREREAERRRAGEQRRAHRAAGTRTRPGRRRARRGGRRTASSGTRARRTARGRGSRASRG